MFYELKIILAGSPPCVEKTIKYFSKEEAWKAKAKYDMLFLKTGEHVHYSTTVEEKDA